MLTVCGLTYDDRRPTGREELASSDLGGLRLLAGR